MYDGRFGVLFKMIKIFSNVYLDMSENNLLEGHLNMSSFEEKYLTDAELGSTKGFQMFTLPRLYFFVEDKAVFFK